MSYIDGNNRVTPIVNDSCIDFLILRPTSSPLILSITMFDPNLHNLLKHHIHAPSVYLRSRVLDAYS